MPPIYQTSTFAFESAEQGAALFAGERRGYIYSRMGNPTVEALEKSVAELEGGYAGLACGSGMAAIHTALAALLQAGDHLVCSDAVYGPTCTLVETILSRFGIEHTIVDTSDLDADREGHAAQHQGRLPRDARQPHAGHLRPRRPSAEWPTSTAPRWSWTTPS